MKEQIERIQCKYPMYGIRRIQLELEQEKSIKANRKRIARIMRKYGLKALIYKGFRVSTTDSKHSNRVYPNLTFGIEVNRPNQLWVTDITYIRIQDGFVFLAVILDIFSRKIVGWAISREINTELCLGALEMSLEQRSDTKGCIHHSDQGVQYTSKDYTYKLKEKGFKISMSRKANCWDNAFVESFFSSLKREEVHLCEYKTFEDVLRSIPKFIEGMYNKKRRHSSLGYLSPNEFEAKWKTGELTTMGISAVSKIWNGSSK